MTIRRTAVLVLAAALTMGLTPALAGCGTDDDGDQDADQATDDGAGVGGSDGEPGDGTGAAMIVSEALEQPAGTEVTVEGFLIEDGGTLFISEALAESFPPQPGGPRAEVEGIDIGQLDGVNQEGPVRWLDTAVTITATVQDGRLIDARTAG